MGSTNLASVQSLTLEWIKMPCQWGSKNKWFNPIFKFKYNLNLMWIFYSLIGKSHVRNTQSNSALKTQYSCISIQLYWVYKRKKETLRLSEENKARFKHYTSICNLECLELVVNSPWLTRHQFLFWGMTHNGNFSAT